MHFGGENSNVGPGRSSIAVLRTMEFADYHSVCTPCIHTSIMCACIQAFFCAYIHAFWGWKFQCRPGMEQYSRAADYGICRLSFSMYIQAFVCANTYKHNVCIHTSIMCAYIQAFFCANIYIHALRYAYVHPCCGLWNFQDYHSVHVLCTVCYVYIHIYIHTYMHIFIYIYIHTYIYSYIFMHTRVVMSWSAGIQNMHVCIHVCMYIYIYIYIYIHYVCIYKYVYVCMHHKCIPRNSQRYHVCMYVCMYIPSAPDDHTHMDICMQTCTAWIHVFCSKILHPKSENYTFQRVLTYIHTYIHTCIHK
jgi:hypothetical protein